MLATAAMVAQQHLHVHPVVALQFYVMLMRSGNFMCQSHKPNKCSQATNIASLRLCK